MEPSVSSWRRDVGSAQHHVEGEGRDHSRDERPPRQEVVPVRGSLLQREQRPPQARRAAATPRRCRAARHEILFSWSFLNGWNFVQACPAPATWTCPGTARPPRPSPRDQRERTFPTGRPPATLKSTPTALDTSVRTRTTRGIRTPLR